MTKRTAIPHATITARPAISFLSFVLISVVSEMNVTSPAIGFTMTKIDVNA